MMAPDLPAWAAAIVAVLMLLGAGITLIGAIGLLRLPNFFQRVHPPTLGMTMGAFFILLSSILCFSVLQSRLVLHELLIGLFLLLTTPVTLMILVQGGVREDGDGGGDGGGDTSPSVKGPADGG